MKAIWTALVVAAGSTKSTPVSTPPPGADAAAPPATTPAPAAVEAPDVHSGGACGAVDVIALPAADRPRLSLAAKPKVDAIVLAPDRFASLPPDQLEPVAAVAEVRPCPSLPAAARGELDAAATATLFPALRAYQAAHAERVVGSYVTIESLGVAAEVGRRQDEARKRSEHRHPAVSRRCADNPLARGC